MKDVAKKLGKKLACSGSVLEDKAIELTGDFSEKIAEVLCKEYKDVKLNNVFNMKLNLVN